MTMIRMVMPAAVNALADDEVEVVISTSQLARDGHILVPAGARLENYRQNPIWLWAHDPRAPIARASEIAVEIDRIRCRVVFAPAGISDKADEIRGLVKAGIVRAVSVGFDPLDMTPLDAGKPRGGQRITAWDLLEVSFCTVGVDTGALVTARALTAAIEEHGMTTEAADDKLAESRKRVLATPDKLQLRDLYAVAQLCQALNALGYVQSDAAWEAEFEADGSAVPAMLGEAMAACGKALIAMTAEEVAELLAGIVGSEGGDGAVARAWRSAVAKAAAPAAPAEIVLKVDGEITEEALVTLREKLGGAERVVIKNRAGRVLSADNHAALTDAHETIARACDTLRSVLDKAEPAEERAAVIMDPNRDYRRRQADKLSLDVV